MSTERFPYVFDADSHWSEPADLFAKAPSTWRDRMPRVKEATLDNVMNGKARTQLCWVFDDQVIGPFSAAGVIGRDGKKGDSHEALFTWPHSNIHEGAYNPKARLAVLDETGIDAQIIYPSTMGTGGQNLGRIGDRAVSSMAIAVYNDTMAEIQSDSENRLLPLPLMPCWDPAACVTEAKRVAALGARGVNMTSAPSEIGGPDFGDRAWDPFWETCSDLQLPLHFHIGAAVTAINFHGGSNWTSHSNNTKLAIGGAMLFIGNAAVAINFAVSGIFDHHPDLKIVSVESGVGWIPFAMEAIEYEMQENAPEDLKKLKKRPIEYFQSNMYATFWFEKNQGRLQSMIDLIGEDNILFETDFPHPTCLYPGPLDIVADKMATITPQAQRKIMGENGRKLYRL